MPDEIANIHLHIQDTQWNDTISISIFCIILEIYMIFLNIDSIKFVLRVLLFFPFT